MENNKEHLILINNWIKKSIIALDDAGKSINMKMFETAQNRLYYAVFYAVSALAKSENFTTTKHTQLLGWFNKNFIKTNKIDKSFAKIYRISFENRQKSDYTFTYVIDKKQIKKDFEDVKNFISEIKKILNIK